MKKERTEHAEVAYRCKKYLKELGIKCSTRSSSYSNGSSVDVYMTDVHPQIRNDIESELKKYQDGHFNGMEDIYEYSANPENLPRVKYLFVNNEMSPNMHFKIAEFLQKKFDVVDDQSSQLVFNRDFYSIVRHIFHDHHNSYDFWNKEHKY